jgi:MoxR-like ATPase
VKSLRREFRDAYEQHLKKFEPNATYKKAPAYSDMMALPIVRGLLHALEHGQSYRFVGEPGIGKTSFVKQLCKILGLRVVIIQAAQISIENLMIPFPIDDPETGAKVLEMVFYKHFTQQGPDDRFVIYIDEPGRGDPTIGNVLMELINEKTLAGRDLPGLVAVVATDNPEGGSGMTAKMDFSHADRFVTRILDSNGTPWKHALAAKFQDLDLNPLFGKYDRMSAENRQILNPRVLDHLIQAVRFGFRAIDVLPITMGDRLTLRDAQGNDKTNAILTELCNALGVQNREEQIKNVVERAIQFAIATGLRIRFDGAPGIGKTSYVKAMLAKLGIAMRYDSAAMLQPEDLAVPMPIEGSSELGLLRTRKMIGTDDQPWVWLLDEAARGSKRTQSAIMPILQEGEVAGEKVGGLRTVIALNNPKFVPGTQMKLDVGRCDLAFATRFALTIELQASDIPATAYLYDKYGDAALQFTEWWKEDLNDSQRALCTPRALERLVTVYEWDGNEDDLQSALPYVNGGYVPVSLVSLKQRLRNNQIARLKQIASNHEEWIEKLSTGNEQDPAFMEAQATVYSALLTAELAQLKEVTGICVHLMYNLTQMNRVALIRSGGDRGKFWLNALRGGKLIHADGPDAIDIDITEERLAVLIEATS